MFDVYNGPCVYRLTSPRGETYIGRTTGLMSRMMSHCRGMFGSQSGSQGMKEEEDRCRAEGHGSFPKGWRIEVLSFDPANETALIRLHRPSLNIRGAGDLSLFDEFTRGDVDEAFKAGRPTRDGLEIRDRIDARLLEYRRSGGSLKLLADHLGLNEKTIDRAAARCG